MNSSKTIIIILFSIFLFEESYADNLSLDLLNDCRSFETERELRRESNGFLFRDKDYKEKALESLEMWTMNYCACISYQAVLLLRKHNKVVPDSIRYVDVANGLRQSKNGSKVEKFCYDHSIKSTATAMNLEKKK